MRGLISLVVLASALSAAPAYARPESELACLDNRLSDDQRAAIAMLFAGHDAANPARPAAGTADASFALTLTLATCGTMHGWSQQDSDTALAYLRERGELSRLALAQGPAWAAAMESFAPVALRLMPPANAISEEDRLAAMPVLPRELSEAPADQPQPGAADRRGLPDSSARRVLAAAAIANGVPGATDAAVDPMITYLLAFARLARARAAFRNLPE